MSVYESIKAVLTGGNGQGSPWPAKQIGPGSLYSDQERIANYFRYTNIYHGRFNRAFSADPLFAGMGAVATRANLAARNLDALHSAIWAGTPEPDCVDANMKAFAAELLDNPKAHEAVGANIFDVALYGDGVFRVDIENSKLCIRTVNPSAYFPELRADKPQEPLAHNIIYPEDADGDWYRRERFYLSETTGTWWLSVSRFHSKTGVAGEVAAPEDLRVKSSPVIHTYAKRLSGLFYGKAPLVDCERQVAEYAANFIKLSAISDMASTKALLAAPYNAFNDKGELVWDTARPYIVDDADMANFDKAKFGWIEPPGMTLVEPILETQKTLKGEVTEAFGLTSAIFGDTGTIRDVGEPGLVRVNLLMEFTVNRYQERFSSFLSELVNVCRELAVTYLSASLPSEFTPVTFAWPDFAPESMGERADTGAKMIAAGAPKAEALKHMGLENPEALVAQANAETAGQFAFPHAPFGATPPADGGGSDALFE